MKEIIFETGINLIETFILIDFLTKYLGCKYTGFKRTVGFLLGWMVTFVELCIINYFVEFETIGTYIPIIIYFLYAICYLKGSTLLKLWMSIVTQIIVTSIAIATNLFVCNIIDYDPRDMITVFNSTRIISVIITKIILFYVTRIVLKMKYKNPMDNHVWIMLITIPVISVISMAALMKAAIHHEEIKIYILIGTACIILADIVTYYLFAVINKDYETKLKIKLLKQQNENSKKNMENTDAFVNQMKSVRHDIQNQLLTICGYIDSGKIEEAKAYINSLTENALPNIQSLINTDNDAFNAIVNAKIVLCNQKKIFMDVKVKENSLKNLDPIDTGVLFGNLLDNAIEAAEKTAKRRISVDVQKSGAYLSILVCNSIGDSVLKNNQELQTSKRDKELHGIGIKTVRELVRKYDGMIQFYEKNNEFCCHILLDNN